MRLLSTLQVAPSIRHFDEPGLKAGSAEEAQWAPAASEAGNHRFVALQPIFDRRRKVFGYEALSRSKWNNRFTGDRMRPPRP